MSNVPAIIITDFEKFHDGPPGTMLFTYDGKENIKGIIFKCPCGCGEIGGGVNFDPSDRGPCWQWNRDQEKPTVTPSIQKLDGCKWHGFLTDGVFVSC